MYASLVLSTLLISCAGALSLVGPSIPPVPCSSSSLKCLPDSQPYANETNPFTHVPGATPANRKEPLQQRLAYVNATAMQVSWNTYDPLGPNEAVVYYGNSPLDLGKTASAMSMTYNTSRTWNHHALLSGLSPKTTYWYRVANSDCDSCSEIPTYTLTTPRSPGDQSAYSLAVVVDMGTMGVDGLSDENGQYLNLTGSHHIPLKKEDSNTIQSLVQNVDTYDAILHPGDIAYADYFIKESDTGYFGNASIKVNMTSVAEGYETILEQYFDEMTPLTSIRPYMVGPGNHQHLHAWADELHRIRQPLADARKSERGEPQLLVFV